MKLRHEPSRPEYLRDPRGRWHAGPSFLHWCLDETLVGWTLWGAPGEAEIRQLLELLPINARVGKVKHAVLADARRLTRADPGAFAALVDYVKGIEARLPLAVSREAVLRPQGIEGAVTAGFWDIAAPAFPVRVFTDSGPAIEWLEVGSRALVAEIDAIVESLQVPAVVRQLRDTLASHASDELDDAAARMTLAPRTLQRRLSEAGTSFQAELASVRVGEARRLLEETELDVAEIAARVGSPSIQAFSTLFRRHTGDSPSAFRAARRK